MQPVHLSTGIINVNPKATTRGGTKVWCGRTIMPRNTHKITDQPEEATCATCVRLHSTFPNRIHRATN